MVDFFMVCPRKKRGVVEIYPKFIIRNPSSDLMIRGGDFYAVWVEEKRSWSTCEQDALAIIDKELDRYAAEYKNTFDDPIKILHMWDAESGMIDNWHKYCQRQMRDSYHLLDEKLIFSNMKPAKRDYSSKQLPYPLEQGSIDAYDKLMSVLYSPEERHKIEWAIGSIVCGESKKIQKFLVLYGAPKTGKSTVLNIILKLFEGYTGTFDAKALGSPSNSFALEAFRTNPLVAVQQDGDLSRIEDNARLNSLVSHEVMMVNEKFKSAYSNRFNSFLFIGTNKPVRITDAKSGLLRRLIDVEPTGNKLPKAEYDRIVKQIDFELGAIAWHCKEIFLEDPGMYDNYVPIAMMGATNDFFNFMLDSYLIFARQDGTTLKAAWEMYKQYCDDARVPYPLSYKNFKEEMRNYFEDFDERPTLDDGSRPRNWFSGFKKEKFEKDTKSSKSKKGIVTWLTFKQQKSLFDDEFANCLAQYETEDGRPEKKWSNVTTKLSDLDTSKVHYVQTPKILITADFDIPDENGNKCFAKNLEAASKWPPTYAELSKSGEGIHLEYFYTGNPDDLQPVYDEYIEIKVQKGNSALRRRLSKCNDIPIATINSGLPLKEKKVINPNNVKSENGLRELIKKNLNKEVHPATKPSIDFIYKILQDAYDSGMKYDVSDMQQRVLIFASESTNNADYCLKKVAQMKFKSDEPSVSLGDDDVPEAIFDVESFPDLFLVCWKYKHVFTDKENEQLSKISDHNEWLKAVYQMIQQETVVRMFNPDPKDIESLMRLGLFGFNNRSYDNHMLYGCLVGNDVQQQNKLSQDLVSDDREGRRKGYAEAYTVSKGDVYDMATVKQGLKKWEIQLGIPHKETDFPWDKPVGKENWDKIADYCTNDVLATEMVMIACEADVKTRKAISSISGLTMNETNRQHITKILVGNAKHADHIYTDLATGQQFAYDGHELTDCPTNNAFPGYEFKRYGDKFDDPQNQEGIKKIRETYTDAGWEKLKNKYVNMYRETDVGFGGYVYAEPGMYSNVALLDVGNMHGASILALRKFGKNTENYREIRSARMAVKHGIKTGDFTEAKKMLDGKLEPYLTDVEEADHIQAALKLVLNSTYGIAAATFDNPLRDARDKNNIIALRGALFMRTLQDEVVKKGYQVVHIKTDSIKIPNATPAIIDFVINFGKKYGYEFEHEATYERFCLVNNAVYIAKYDDQGNRSKGGKHAGEWTATGTQFAVPYVFKKLFSKEDILFGDMCETKSVKIGNIYLDMNERLTDVTAEEKELAKMIKMNPEADVSELQRKIAKGHDYQFIGRVGLFCPIKPGAGGGVLYRESEGKYYAVAGTTGYRWMEADMVKALGKENDIDISYYDRLCDEAVKAISEYGDFDSFVNLPANEWPDIDFPF